MYTVDNRIIHTPCKFDVFCVFRNSRMKGGLVELGPLLNLALNVQLE